MITAWFATDKTGRVNSSTTEEQYAGEDFVKIEVDDNFDFLHQGDYIIKDGALVYDGAQTAEEEAAEAAAEAAKAIEEEKNAFFAPGGGKSKMEQDIKDADASAASMNEYLDALLGLNTTDETEATDAE